MITRGKFLYEFSSMKTGISIFLKKEFYGHISSLVNQGYFSKQNPHPTIPIQLINPHQMMYATLC